MLYISSLELVIDCLLLVVSCAYTKCIDYIVPPIVASFPGPFFEQLKAWYMDHYTVRYPLPINGTYINYMQVFI